MATVSAGHTLTPRRLSKNVSLVQMGDSGESLYKLEHFLDSLLVDYFVSFLISISEFTVSSVMLSPPPLRTYFDSISRSSSFR